MSKLMIVTFTNISGKKINIECDPEQTIKDIMVIVAEKFDAKNDKIRLIYSGKPLSEDQTLKNINYQQGTTVIVHISRRPVAPPPSTPAPSVSTPPQPSQTSTTPTASLPNPIQQPVAPPPSNPISPPVSAQPSQPQGNSETSASHDEAISELMSMGYNLNQCEVALRLANGDLSLAANLLIEGRIPAKADPKPPQPREPILYNYGHSNAMFKPDKNCETLRNLVFLNFNHGVSSIIAVLNNIDPELSAKIQENPAPMMRMLGIPAQASPNGIVVATSHPRVPSQAPPSMQPGMQPNMQPGVQPSMQPNMQQPMNRPPSLIEQKLASYTQEEQNSIKRLVEMGFDLINVIQAFDACDKNEQQAANLLLSMNN
ncbi:hypothetical protein TRFO_02344 [Tritrichomonas foetus]|uniref:UV excision repair protein RAD23 n=1 Tax=Tritrichomonas foetus TaxID=1144522 RepID=A0A1J4J2Z2_9EUKA|nr:hypothetical protein TRFO_02344 [Tritrichomonas foetus]|eukprot:OHS93824.1 hypothetical protein TRFO_02344 [Tritrichomonas foetus]